MEAMSMVGTAQITPRRPPARRARDPRYLVIPHLKVPRRLETVLKQTAIHPRRLLRIRLPQAARHLHHLPTTLKP